MHDHNNDVILYNYENRLVLTIPINLLLKIRCEEDFTHIKFSSAFLKINNKLSLSSKLQKWHVANKIIQALTTKRRQSNVYVNPIINFDPENVDRANTFYCDRDGRFNANYMTHTWSSYERVDGLTCNIICLKHRSGVFELTYSENGSPFYLCMEETYTKDSLLNEKWIGVALQNDDVALQHGELVVSIVEDDHQKIHERNPDCFIFVSFTKNVDNDFFYCVQYYPKTFNTTRDYFKYLILIYNQEHGFNVISIPTLITEFTEFTQISQCIVNSGNVRLLFVRLDKHKELYVYNLKSGICIKTITIRPGHKDSSYSMVNLSNNWVVYSDYSKKHRYLRMIWINCITLESERTYFQNFYSKSIEDIQFFAHDDDIGILIENVTDRIMYSEKKSILDFQYHS